MAVQAQKAQAVTPREEQAVAVYRPNRIPELLRVGLKTLIALLMAAFALYPIVWIVSTSLNPANTLASATLIPTNASLANFQLLYTHPQFPFLLWIWNSIKIAGITSIIVTSVTALAAYSFSRFRYRGRRFGLLSILLIQLFPNMLAVVALYLMLLELGKIPGLAWLGINTHGGLILIYSGGALGFNTWLMKGFFDTIPKELDEAAIIDGAGSFQVFWQIILPLARPILAVMAVLTFIGVYGDFLIARVMLKSKDSFTLMVGLSNLVQGRTTEWGVFAAAALVGAVPIVVYFLVMQKQIVGGLTGGAVKG